MMRIRPLITATFIMLSLLSTGSLAPADIPDVVRVDGVPRIKQLKNYCGPACLAAVMQQAGEKVTQEMIGQAVYDASSGATNGADMLLYAREKGFSAYSWNADLSDVKQKLAAGVPVIVLQQNSATDTSGHYRVLTGYDDAAQKFLVMDPYYDNITEMSYAECEKLWNRLGNWALLVAPAGKDKFRQELDERNPVVHMDLAYAQYKRKEYEAAQREATVALNLEPGNSFALSILDKIEYAIGAGAKKSENDAADSEKAETEKSGEPAK